MKEPYRSLRQEPVLGAIAFVAVFLLVMFIGVAVLVGEFDIDPRRSALLSLAPAIILGVVAAAIRPARRFFAVMLFR